MKHIVIGIGSVLLAGILALAVTTIYGRSLREEELNQALASGMELAMEQTGAGTLSGLGDDEELVAVFLENFLMQLESSSDITVHVLDVDAQKGLLSVEAVMGYRHPIGSMGSVAVRKTLIRECSGREEDAEFCGISYFVEGNCYKEYNVRKGSNILIPAAPTVEGKDFKGWREADGTDPVSLRGRQVEQDCVFVAVFQ